MSLTDSYYEARFENEFYRAKGNAFQSFFNRLMSMAFRSDFLPCQPWGNRGDKKNDGYLKSKRRLFQVYAPHELTEKKAKSKITEDFEGAKRHWKTHFDEWVFVHNAYDGLPVHIHELIRDFADANPDISLTTWSLEELREIFRSLSPEDKASWLGEAPTSETCISLGFEDIRVVLEQLDATTYDSISDVRDVPTRKIEANALSNNVAEILKTGMTKAPMVEQFFENWHDETFGERMAVAFRKKYEELRGKHSPDQLFFELWLWVGGQHRNLPKHEMAVFAVLAYFFERCDIFEEPRNPKS